MSGTYQRITVLDLLHYRNDAPGGHHVLNAARRSGKTTAIVKMAERLPWRCIMVFPTDTRRHLATQLFTVDPIPAIVLHLENQDLSQLQRKLRSTYAGKRAEHPADTLIFDEYGWFADRRGLCSVISEVLVPNFLVPNFTTFYLGSPND